MFTGFSPETVDFLWGVRLNNNRTWFEAHKQDYQRTLYEPMKALGAQIFAQFRDVPNMAYKVSRIYKDARMHPPTPYKESLWLSMRPDELPWSEQPTLYFEIRPEGYCYGFVLWKPKIEAMERGRALMASDPEAFLSIVRKAEAETGLKLSGDAYKRKKPCAAELEPYYNLKGFMMDTDRAPDDLLFSPALAEEVIHTLKALYPLYEYCLKFTT